LRFISITLSDVGDIDDVVDIPLSFPNPNIFFIRFKPIVVEEEEEEEAEGDEAKGDNVADIIGQTRLMIGR
jgi:hypothetical protein